MSQRPRVVVVGSLVMDFVASAPALPRPGETVLGNEFGIFPGGKGANQAVQAARLGAEVYLIGRVGQDGRGDRLLQALEMDGVHTDFIVRDQEAPTAACCIHVDQNGQNSIVIVPAANAALSPADVDAARKVLDSASIILAQLEVPVATVLHAFALAGQRGIRTILNPAPAQPLPADLLACTTVLTPNELEVETLAGRAGATRRAGWESELAGWLLEQGVQTAIITLAEKGCYARTRAGEIRQPAFAVKAVDTTAAGDAFSGALAVSLAEGAGLPQALRFASAAGALATTRAGAQPSMPYRAEVEELEQRG